MGAMDYNTMQMLLSELLNCGYADLNIISDTKYDWSDIIEKARDFGNIDLHSLFLAIVDIGLENLNEEIDNRIEELKNDNDITHEEIIELDILKTLDVGNDFETFFNFLDTHVYLKNNQEVYEKYLGSEMKTFEENSGFNLEY